ncbi:hypothetical protein EVAR_45685_1 [Eumeta japonica]|uniref:Uncharacterized protein n=1 Tax=Eumeta variegata TaxID=151549 RepID=A0A4C1XMS8_EUMVA|nr:hypothetical protein EVAR_45685_1 [Eumeta japonica]
MESVRIVRRLGSSDLRLSPMDKMQRRYASYPSLQIYSAKYEVCLLELTTVAATVAPYIGPDSGSVKLTELSQYDQAKSVTNRSGGSFYANRIFGTGTSDSDVGYDRRLYWQALDTPTLRSL